MRAGTLPVDNKLVIYRGGSGQWQLTFADVSGTPINLTGKTFVAQVRDRTNGPLLLNLTVTGTSLSTGVITISWSATDTANIPIRESRWGLIDDDDVLWINDVCRLEGKIPEN